MNLLIRTRGGMQYGMGHIVRSVRIAQSMPNYCKIVFLIDKNKAAQKLLSINKFNFVYAGSKSTQDFIVNFKPDVILVDILSPQKREIESLKKYAGEDFSKVKDAKEAGDIAKKMSIEVDKKMSKWEIIAEIFDEKVEPNLMQPTFITDYPKELSPLAKSKPDNPELVERFESFIAGMEMSNAFSELNDPLDQRERFQDQLELGKRGDEEAMVLDEDFLRALEYGMPPTAGLGIGIDRLAMIITNSNSIQDVLFFPQMKPEKKPVDPSIELKSAGIREDLIPVLLKLGHTSSESIQGAKPGKLFNDVCGMRKKMKLNDVKNPTMEEIEGWIS